MINLSMPYILLIDRARAAYAASTDILEADHLDLIIMATEKSMKSEALTDTEADALFEFLIEYHCERE